jgi:hypothetical protein
MKFGKHQPSSSVCSHPIHADLQLARININHIEEYHCIAGGGNQTAGRIAVPSAWAPMSFAAVGDPPTLSALPRRLIALIPNCFPRTTTNSGDLAL